MTRWKRIAVEAREVSVGDVILDGPDGAPGRMWKRLGARPQVTDVSFLEDGENGNPTVYIETADAPGEVYCYSPDEVLIVRA